MTFLSAFDNVDIEVGGVRIHGRVAGSGSPILLLHGYPQTHVMWHRVAPALAHDYTVVVADLRGYGDSDKPVAGSDHAEYSKRAMAADQVGLMSALGFERFAAVGHDRGARVVHRMCLDHPDTVTRAAVLDIAPTRHMLATVDRDFALSYWHWFFLAQPADLPERMIGSDPEKFLRQTTATWSAGGRPFDEAAMAEYLRCFRDPAMISATCEDYRAATTIDLDQDDSDFDAGLRLRCPLLVLWGLRGFIGKKYEPLEVWRDYADRVEGGGLDSGHFLAEEQPEATTAALREFLAAAVE